MDGWMDERMEELAQEAVISVFVSLSFNGLLALAAGSSAGDAAAAAATGSAARLAKVQNCLAIRHTTPSCKMSGDQRPFAPGNGLQEQQASPSRPENGKQQKRDMGGQFPPAAAAIPSKQQNTLELASVRSVQTPTGAGQSPTRVKTEMSNCDCFESKASSLEFQAIIYNYKT
ncbi:hypothetical protein FOCC_FOCC006784 [Frankliniella occidentalis]|nr:hypothetical protein FOCC_FOCC006784 [Frankliniella occidentalis]